MSFAEKLGTLMRRPGEDIVPKDEVPWWLKYAGRGCGAFGGGFAIFLGVWNCLGILLGDIWCLLGGLWQMIAGFVVLMIEAPCCCMFIDFVQTLSDWADKRPYWNRAAFYVFLGIPGILFCISLSSIMGSGLIILTGVLYGMMALGRKATIEEMRANVAQKPPNANLIANAAPMGHSTLPPV